MTRVKKAEAFRLASVNALEEYAREVLDVNAVLAAAAVEAAQGHRVALIPIERLVDVSGTEAGKELKATLEREGFKVEWRKRSVIIAGSEVFGWILALIW